MYNIGRYVRSVIFVETAKNLIVYMLNYPDVLRKVQAEIDEVLGRHKTPCMRDKQNMPFVEATIMEIQRSADIAPLGVPHSVMEDVEFREYTIPKGTTVMTNLYSENTLYPKAQL